MHDPCREVGHALKIKITYTQIYPLLVPWEYAKTCLFTPKIYLLPWEKIQKDYRFQNKCSKIVINSFSSLLTETRSYAKQSTEKKKKSKIIINDSSYLCA
jgi:hypothetical protein